MTGSADWLADYTRLAEEGDATAQIALAWEYATGEKITQDFEAAVRLFRQAEQKKPGLARFYLAKLKILRGDPTFMNEIPDRYEPSFGPALYLMGVAKKRGISCEPNVDEAVRYFDLAAQDNHLVSRFFAWRLRRKSIMRWLMTLPSAVFLSMKILVIQVRNPNDVRVLT